MSAMMVGDAVLARKMQHRPFLIAVSGGTASGKSSVCQKIVDLLGQNKVDQQQRQVVILSQDSFYKVLTAEQKAKASKGQYNFDHPDAFDNELILRTLKDIINGQTVSIPVYDFVTHSRFERHQRKGQGPGTNSDTVHHLCKTSFRGVLPSDQEICRCHHSQRGGKPGCHKPNRAAHSGYPDWRSDQTQWLCEWTYSAPHSTHLRVQHTATLTLTAQRGAPH
ncbi:uridine-cytidine kinase 1-like isoform X5 [Heterodontus francisci]|uniref:uridine-cytidine kinase 1-like isoform X5 n=1 Tax=Heterodontus francisci TaxID=7792 RepID=UPI00355C8600